MLSSQFSFLVLKRVNGTFFSLLKGILESFPSNPHMGLHSILQHIKHCSFEYQTSLFIRGLNSLKEMQKKSMHFASVIQSAKCVRVFHLLPWKQTAFPQVHPAMRWGNICWQSLKEEVNEHCSQIYLWQQSKQL